MAGSWDHSNRSQKHICQRTWTNDNCSRRWDKWGGKITADKWLQFQISPPDAETEATTWSLPDTEHVTIQLEREIDGITWNGRKRFKKDFSIRMIGFQGYWETIGIQAFRITVEQRVILLQYPKIHLVSHISETIRWMGSGDNFTTYNSQRLHITNLKEAYWACNKFNYIRQMLKNDDWCTGLDSMEQVLSYLALERWYGIDSVKDFNILSATDERRSTLRAHLLPVQTMHEKPIIRQISQQVYHLWEMNVHGVCRCIIWTSLREVLEDCGIPNFGQRLHFPIEEDCTPKVSGLMLGYDQNVLIDSIFIKLQHGLLYYRQPFHNPTSIECLCNGTAACDLSRAG